MKLDKQDVKILKKAGYNKEAIEEMDYLLNDRGNLICRYDELGKWYTNEYVTDTYDSTFLVDSFDELPFKIIPNKEELEKELKENNIVLETIDDNVSSFIDIIERYIDWNKYGKEVVSFFTSCNIISINDGEYFVCYE